MSRLSLANLAAKYFRQNGYQAEKDAILEGASGLSRKFDLIIRRGREKRSVWIKDWNRTVGVNIVINIDKAAEDIGFSKPIIEEVIMGVPGKRITNTGRSANCENA